MGTGVGIQLTGLPHKGKSGVEAILSGGLHRRTSPPVSTGGWFVGGRSAEQIPLDYNRGFCCPSSITLLATSDGEIR